jgi:hypothetical protein
MLVYHDYRLLEEGVTEVGFGTEGVRRAILDGDWGRAELELSRLMWWAGWVRSWSDVVRSDVRACARPCSGGAPLSGGHRVGGARGPRRGSAEVSGQVARRLHEPVTGTVS